VQPVADLRVYDVDATRQSLSPQQIVTMSLLNLVYTATKLNPVSFSSSAMKNVLVGAGPRISTELEIVTRFEDLPNFRARCVVFQNVDMRGAVALEGR
jgi:hypothetical protein